MMTVLYNEILCERPNSAAVGAYSTALGNGATKAEASKAASNAVEEKSTPQYDVNVKDVFNDLSLLNYTENSISSLGSYVSNMNLDIVDRKRIEIRNMVPENSLAYKILQQKIDYLGKPLNNQLTDKQKWVIAYELQKNKSYTNKLGAEIAKRKRAADSKAYESKMKKSANKKASQPLLNEIKSKGLRLGDYYKWLNTSGNRFRSEYFSKKYSSASVNAFLNSKK